MANLEQIKVEKKDGSQEPYMRSKLLASMTKAGASQEEAEAVANQVEAWMEGAAEAGPIKTDAIREKVLEYLGSTNQTAAQAYQSYKKPE